VFAAACTVATAANRWITPGRNCRVADAAATPAGTAVRIRCTGFGLVGARVARQTERGQRHAREAEAEFLKRPAACTRLSHGFGQFIKLVVHVFPFVGVFGFNSVIH
jgi:hypothetical protein